MHVCVIYCVWECASVSVWIQAFIALFTCQCASPSYKFGAATEILLGAYVKKIDLGACIHERWTLLHYFDVIVLKKTFTLLQ